ncbi:LysE family translocator [Frigidibacter sp. ROC022]|uniref:LysE family translocator n=1 Tax=Frigidibacter sp. ROC022 TaxID=2971796 RepID=UPI00215B5E54|nr:LysE family translocator [Frigidibacter sp. ROC022]MCR8724975.1 LysE family translocator [Frigidibacter sp. ROC022]
MLELLPAIPAATWFTFLAASIALNLTPGSDVMFISASAAAGGPRAGVAAALGISAGSLLHVALAVLGVAALIQSSQAAWLILRWGGAAYLLWLAWGLWRAPPPGRTTGGNRRAWRAFRRGAANCALNPKVSVFVLAFLPQFADPALGPLWVQIALFGLVFALGSVPVNIGWALAASALGAPIRRAGRMMNRLAAGVFALLAARLVWE